MLMTAIALHTWQHRMCAWTAGEAFVGISCDWTCNAMLIEDPQGVPCLLRYSHHAPEDLICSTVTDFRSDQTKPDHA